MSEMFTLKSGDQVTVIFFSNGDPHMAIGTVHTESPMSVFSDDPRCELLGIGSRVMVIHQEDETCRSDAKVVTANKTGDRWFFEFQSEEWENLNKRQFPRFECEMPINLRMVFGSRGGAVAAEYDAVTHNLSVGGALIKTDADLVKGLLFRCHVDLPGTDGSNVLALVAHKLQDGFYGIEFVDYFGSARYNLSSFLSKLAA